MEKKRERKYLFFSVVHILWARTQLQDTFNIFNPYSGSMGPLYGTFQYIDPWDNPIGERRTVGNNHHSCLDRASLKH